MTSAMMTATSETTMTFFKVRVIREIEIGRADTMVEALTLALEPSDHDYPERLTVEVTEVNRDDR